MRRSRSTLTRIAPGPDRRARGRRPRRDAQRDVGSRRPGVEDQPLIPVELVIDHSVQVDAFASRVAFGRNVELEFERNHERYLFLRWGQESFRDFKVVPPGTGICHQVNLEYLARVVEDRDGVAFPDTLVGTDSHTTMVNGLGVLGWGAGGIEAEAAMLGQPLSMLVPQVVGFKLSGMLPDGSTATDLVLTVTEMLRKTGVVGKFVEYYGEGLAGLSLADRATIGNMSPEYGATCGFFPVDQVTLDYLRLTGRATNGSRSSRRTARRTSSGTTRARTRRTRRSSSSTSAMSSRRSPGPAARRTACRSRDAKQLRRGTRHVRRRLRERLARPRRRRHLPGLRPDDRAAAGRDAGAGRRPRPRLRRGAAAPAHARRRPGLRARPRLGRDRSDHVVHEHLEPTGDGRRRLARSQRDRARASTASRGSSRRSRRARRSSRVLRAGGAAAAPRRTRLQHRRLRLHYLHRQLRPARRRDLRRRSPKATWSSARCSPATATSRRASIPR